MKQKGRTQGAQPSCERCGGEVADVVDCCRPTGEGVVEENIQKTSFFQRQLSQSYVEGHQHRLEDLFTQSRDLCQQKLRTSISPFLHTCCYILCEGVGWQVESNKGKNRIEKRREEEGRRNGDLGNVFCTFWGTVISWQLAMRSV